MSYRIYNAAQHKEIISGSIGTVSKEHPYWYNSKVINAARCSIKSMEVGVHATKRTIKALENWVDYLEWEYL